MGALENYLTQTQDLTIMPPVLMSVLNLNDDNDMSFDKLENMVQTDQILVARMLRLANSPFYSRGNRIQNIKQIITRLGFRTVRSMIAMAFVDSIFASGNYKKFREEIWEHSIAKGIIGQYVCRDLGLKKESDVCMLGGILQDLGKIVLNTIDRKKYIQVLTRYVEQGGDIRVIEKELFEVDNIELGEAVANQWSIPKEICEIIATQHGDVGTQSKTSTIVAFSALVARKAGYGRWEPEWEERYNNFMDFLGMSEEKREELHTNYSAELVNDELYKFTLSSAV